MINIVHDLRRARGGNSKKQILMQHTENYMWIKALLYMYDTSKNYYVAAPADFSFVENISDYSGMFDILDELATGNYIGSKGRALAKQGSSKYGEIFRLILNGSLSAGVSTTTLNKIYNDFIPTFPLMLAEDSEIRQFPVLASTKYDGVRLVVFVMNNVVTPKTRSGKTLNLSSLIKSMKISSEGVYDGELVAGNGLQNNRTGITGSVNSILKGGSDDIKDYTFVIFDYISIHDWISKKCELDYSERLRQLDDQFFPDMNIKIIENIEINRPEDIESLYQERLTAGYEGLIVRYASDPYVWERSPALIKKKATKECVLRCIGVNEGTGKYAGLVGSLVCEGEVEDHYVKVNVGSGLSKYDVEQTFDHYIDHDIEVLYNTIIKADKKEFYSLFLPRFKRVAGNKDI